MDNLNYILISIGILAISTVILYSWNYDIAQAILMLFGIGFVLLLLKVLKRRMPTSLKNKFTKVEIKKFINKYPEYILTITGVWLFAYVSLFYCAFPFSYHCDWESGYNYTAQAKFLAVILVTLGVALGIRKYFKKQ
jgi:hypothetical protein